MAFAVSIRKHTHERWRTMMPPKNHVEGPKRRNVAKKRHKMFQAKISRNHRKKEAEREKKLFGKEGIVWRF